MRSAWPSAARSLSRSRRRSRASGRFCNSARSSLSGHVLAALAPDYGLLMGARVLAAISHASFLGIAAIVAAASVPPERSARAVSLRVARFLRCEPRRRAGRDGDRPRAWLARRLLDARGGWRHRREWLFSSGCPPRRAGEASSFRQEIVALRRPQVLLAMAMSLLVCASTFAVFTYVAPLLLEETRISAGALPLMLLLFGVGGAAGMVIGGRLGDWKPLESVAALSFAYAVFYLILIAVVESARAHRRRNDPLGLSFPGPVRSAADAGREEGDRRTKPRLDAQPVRLQRRQRDWADARRRGAFLGFGIALPWIGAGLSALLCAATGSSFPAPSNVRKLSFSTTRGVVSGSL